MLAKKQKNYLLSFALFQRCKRLGYKKSHTLLYKLEQEKKNIEKKHKKFIAKVMQKITPNTLEALVDRYIFAIVKMQRSHYVVATLVPYLKSKNESQRLLAIKALGKLGNTYTKYKGKDSVEWFLTCLEKFQDKKTIIKHQQEVEEIIWALGWLKDKRANYPVYKFRLFIEENSLLWVKTAIPYRWIPLGKISTKHIRPFFIKGDMKQYARAIVDYNQAISLNPKDFLAYYHRGFSYRHLKEYTKVRVLLI